MKHIVLPSQWEWKTAPLHAYGVRPNDLSKAITAILVKDVTPNLLYEVVDNDGTIHALTTIASDAKEVYNKVKKTSTIIPNHILPENQFIVQQSQDKSLIVITKGRDETSRCLLFASFGGPDSGNVTILTKKSSADIISEHVEHQPHECFIISIAAIFNIGDCIVVHDYKRESDEVYQILTWDGENINITNYSSLERQMVEFLVNPEDANMETL